MLIALVIICLLLAVFLPQYKTTVKTQHQQQMNALQRTKQLQEQLNAQQRAQQQMMDRISTGRAQQF